MAADVVSIAVTVTL